MSFSKWFSKGGSKQASDEYSIDDLIVLERYEAAEERLKAHLKKKPRDLHSQLKLAEVCRNLKRNDEAVDLYVHVADEYARDGFYNKSKALLRKAVKLRPLDDKLNLKLQALDQMKRMEQSRVVAVGSLSSSETPSRGAASLEIQRHWAQLAKSVFVSELDQEQIKLVFAAVDVRSYQIGEVIARAGSREGRIFLIAQGTIEALLTEPETTTTTLRTFGPSDLIGEGSLLEHRPWPARYRVAEAATCLTLDRAGLEKCLVGNPNPKGFLDALRRQGLDREVASAVQRLGGSD